MVVDREALAIVRRRMHAQRLIGRSSAGTAEAVAWSGAVQAQEYAEAHFSWWSGLTIADAKAGLRAAGDRLVAEVDAEGTPWIAAPRTASAPAGRDALLLGTYDEMLVAYRELRGVRADGRPSTELLRRPVMIGGRTLGGWTRRLKRRSVTVEVALDATPSRKQREALHDAVARYGAFVGLPAELRLRASA